MKAVIPAAALLFAIAMPFSGQAQTTAPATTETIAVVYADLDLNQPAETRLLNSRLRSAALRVCGDSNLVVAAQRAHHWCVREVMQDGWAQVAVRRADRSAASRTVTLAALRTAP